MPGAELERAIKHIWNRVACGIKLQNAYSGAFLIRDISQIPSGKFLLLSNISKYRCCALNVFMKAALIHLLLRERNPERKTWW